MVPSRLWGVPSLRIFKDLKNPEGTLENGSPSLSSTRSSNCVLSESDYSTLLTAPSLDNVIKEYDYSPMSSSPKNFPSPCPLPTVQYMLCCFDVDLI